MTEYTRRGRMSSTLSEVMHSDTPKAYRKELHLRSTVAATFEVRSVDLICKVYASSGPKAAYDEGPHVGCVRMSNLYTGRSREVFISRWHYRITDARNTKVIYTVGRTP